MLNGVRYGDNVDVSMTDAEIQEIVEDEVEQAFADEEEEEEAEP